MNFHDTSPKLKGHWLLDIYEGEIERSPGGVILNPHVEQLEGENLVVTVGKQLILDRLYGLSAVGAMTRLGVGTSATAAAVGNTSLTGGVFVAFDATPIRTSLTVAAISTFGTGTANITWAELGADNGTTLLARIAPIGPFSKSAAVSIVVTYSLSQA